jgi:hypothetical protein
MAEHRFFPASVEEIPLPSTPFALVRFDDAEGSAAWGFRHECGRWPDEREPDGEFVKIIAPRLTNHTVTRTDQGVTVRASILCPDCAAHGYVTDSEWKNA